MLVDLVNLICYFTVHHQRSCLSVLMCPAHTLPSKSSSGFSIYSTMLKGFYEHVHNRVPLHLNTWPEPSLEAWPIPTGPWVGSSAYLSYNDRSTAKQAASSEIHFLTPPLVLIHICLSPMLFHFSLPPLLFSLPLRVFSYTLHAQTVAQFTSCTGLWSHIRGALWWGCKITMANSSPRKTLLILKRWQYNGANFILS